MLHTQILRHRKYNTEGESNDEWKLAYAEVGDARIQSEMDGEWPSDIGGLNGAFVDDSAIGIETKQKVESDRANFSQALVLQHYALQLEDQKIKWQKSTNSRRGHVEKRLKVMKWWQTYAG